MFIFHLDFHVHLKEKPPIFEPIESISDHSLYIGLTFFVRRPSKEINQFSLLHFDYTPSSSKAISQIYSYKKDV